MVARKGQPNLGNDPARRSDWRERTTAENNKLANARLAFRTDDAFVVLLAKAAKTRGMTSAGYARRAVSVFIAADLQVPFEEVCAHCPAIEHGGGLLKTWPRDDGNGYGKWEVKS